MVTGPYCHQRSHIAPAAWLDHWTAPVLCALLWKRRGPQRGTERATVRLAHHFCCTVPSCHFSTRGVIAASARKSSYSLFSMSLEPYSDALHIVMSDVDIYLTTQRKISIHSSLLAACSKFFARSLDPSWVKQHGSSSRPSDEGFAYRLDLKKNPSEDFLIRQVGLYFILARSIAKAVSRIPQPTQILPSPTFKTNVPVTKPIIEPSKTSSMFSATAGQSWEIFRIFWR